MTLTVKGSTSDFEMQPEGVHPARCFQLIDLGTQTSQFGEAKKVMITWELLGDEKRKDGTPFTISNRYTASLNNKATLYKELTSWRGVPFTEEDLAGFDLKKVVGAYCLLQIQHKPNADGTRTFANITSIMSLPKSMPKPDPVNDNVILDLDEFDHEAFNSLTPRTRLLIQQTPEWTAWGESWKAKGAIEAAENPEGGASVVTDIVLSDLPGDDDKVGETLLDAAMKEADKEKDSLEPKYDPITDPQKRAISAILASKGVATHDMNAVASAVAKTQGHEIANIDELSKVWASDLIPELERQSKAALELFFKSAPLPTGPDGQETPF